MLRWLVVLVAFAAGACSSPCDHHAYCDGNFVVGCARDEDDDSSHESRYACENGNTCVQPPGVSDAFCSWSAEPLAVCAGPEGADVAACDGDRPVYCLGGYPL